MPKFKHRTTHEIVDAIKFVDGNGGDVMAFAKASQMSPAIYPGQYNLQTARQCLIIERDCWVVRYCDDSMSAWYPESFKGQFEEVGAPAIGDGDPLRCLGGLYSGIFNQPLREASVDSPTKPVESRATAVRPSVRTHQTYRERAPLNLWDSFSPREFLASPDRGSTVRGDHSITLRLFGNRNVGLTVRTNLLMAGQVPRDESYVITNWYARTNVHALPAEFHAFASSAIVSLVVGEKTRHEAPLAALLRGRSRYYEGWTPEASSGLAVSLFATVKSLPDRDAAMSAWDQLPDADRDYWRQIAHAANLLVLGNHNVKTQEISDALTQEALARNVYACTETHVGRPDWRQLPSFAQDHWRDISRVAHGMVTPAVLALIPECQTYAVSISVDRRALGRLLEVLPTDTAPESLIWIHLEGVRRV